MANMTNPLPAYRGNDSYIFVSYSHKDSEMVYAEIRSMQDQGIRVWFDEGIDAGEEWTETLAVAIDGCSNFFFFITSHSAGSEHCRRELNYANQKGVAVTAIHLVPTDLPGGMQLSLGHRQAIIKYELSDSQYESKLFGVLGIGGIAEAAEDYSSLAAEQSVDKKDQRRGILVLPFVSRSREEDTQFLCDGIADEIITALSAVESLRVISGGSARQIDVKTRNLRSLGRQLNVQYVLEGSVQLSGEKLRITAQLPSTDSDDVLWASKWDSSVADIFDVQETIAQGVVLALEIQLSRTQKKQLVDRPIPDVHAYEFYLRARQLIHLYTADALHQALEYLRKGEEIIGENIHITAAIGYVHWQFLNAGIDLDPQHLEEARGCIERLFKLEPDSPDAHRLKGLVGMKEKDELPASINHLKIALEANPNDTDTLFWLTLLYAFAGRVSSGMALSERLLAIDPLTTLHKIYPGYLTFMDGDFEKACPLLLHCHELNPGNPITTLIYGQVLAMVDKYEQAQQIFASLNEFAADTFFSQLGKFFSLSLAGDKAAALAAATDDLEAEASSDLQYSWSLAQCYALIGEQERAITWLQNAIDYGFWNYPLLATHDPLLESIRQNEKFQSLMNDLKQKWIYFQV